MSRTKLRGVPALLMMGAAYLVGSGLEPSQATETTRVQDQRRMAINQLRIYEIFDRNKVAFHERFRDHAARIMQRYDFKIVAMWEASREGKTEFVYLLHWPDRSTMSRQWERFMADEEWASIKEKTAAEHGQMVGEIQSRVLDLTDYSPSL